MVRSDEIGDTMLTLPLLWQMRRVWPKAWITLVARSLPSTLYERCALVNDVIAWDPITVGRRTLVGQARALSVARRRLLDRDYDLAVLPRWDEETGGARHVAVASRARCVAGFDPRDRPGTTDGGETELLSLRVPAGDPAEHEIEHGRDLLRALGVAIDEAPPLDLGLNLVSAPDHATAQGLLSPVSDLPGALVAIAPGAGAAKRRWPTGRFVRVLAEAASRHPIRVAILGSDQDAAGARTLALALPAEVPVVDAAGRAGLRESLALLARSAVYIGGDTGLMHMSSSVGTPCVVVSCHPLMGSPRSANAPGRFGPWHEHSRVLQPRLAAPGCDAECVADRAHCIDGVGEREVVDALTDVLATVDSRDLAS